MNRHDRGMWLLAGVTLALLAGGPGRAQDAPGPTQTVTLLVRGPDGAPLRDHVLTEFRIGPFASQMPLVSVPTDGLGRATVTVTTPAQFSNYGLGRLGVFAPGVGVGMTGVIEVGPDGRATVPLPPLSPFAHLSGTVAPQLRHPGESIRLDESSSQMGLPGQTVTVDAQGRFALDDVPPGQAQLVAENDAGTRPGQGPRYYFGYRLAPGEVRTGVVLSPPKAGQFYDPATYTPPTITTRTVTLRGTVTDDGGRPLAGATVYAQVPKPTPQSGYWPGGGAGLSGNDPFGRQGPPALTTATGADGRYSFAAVTVGTGEVVIPVTVSAPGHAPAFVAATVAADAPGEVHADLVVSTRRTALTVRVVGPDGRPVPSALVRLTPEAGFPQPRFGGSFISEAAVSLQAPAPEGLFALSGGTGPDGAARFLDLEPGLWDVTATSGPVPTFDGPAPGYRSAESRGVAVQAGAGAACTLALAPRPIGPTVRVLGPDGKVVPVAYAALDPGSATLLLQTVALVGPNHPSPSPTGDAPVQDYLIQPGLWHVGGSYRDPGVSSEGYYGGGIPEPYNEANALLALSPALPPPGLIVLHALHHGPGSIRVRLEDARGRPARGTVVVPGFGSGIEYEASADARGGVVFAGMPSGDYTLQGYPVDEPTPPGLADTDAPLPPDAALASRPVQTPLKVTVAGDHETAVTLRPRPVGYVRVTLRLTPPDTALGFFVYSGDPAAQTRRDKTAGAFLVGPFPPGPATLYLSRAAPNGSSANAGKATVNVVAGRVTDTSMVPNALGLPAGAGGVSLYYRGGSVPAHAAPSVNTVYLSDGVTPAWGAEAVLCLPGYYAPQQPERADALGHLQPGTLQLPPAPVRPGGPPSGTDPTGPVLIAWLPGTAGAAIVPYTPGQAQKITLPPALTVTGRVTVGGRSPTGLPGTLRVRAQYQGRGRLNDLLSVDVTAGPDGAFTLDGLTPGTYQVQAARDGIWLSATQAVTVGNASAPSVTLDIGPAGAPVTLHLSPGEAVSLDRPAGPLTDELWPATVHADGVGDLRLDGLEAGRHTVRPVGGGPEIGFEVPEPTSLLRGVLPKREDAEKSRQPHALALLILPFREDPVSAANKEVGSGILSGRVTDADGKPAAGVTVTARSTTYISPAPAAQAVTGADGRYTLRLDTQANARLFAPDAPADRTFIVTVAAGSQFYVIPSDRTVTLTGTPSPAATGADFVVTAGPQITVRVHDALTGAPVPGVRVEYPSVGGGNAPGELAGVTDARGRAVFRTHDLNVRLQIRAGPNLQAAPGQNLYKYALLSPLQGAVWDVAVTGPKALVDFAWRGVALGPDGKPVAGALVRLLRAPASPLQVETVTDDAGHFTFAPSAAAPYDLAPQSPVLLAERDDLSAVASAPFDVSGGEIMLRLRKTVRATVTGLITAPNGVPLAGVPVSGSGYVPPAPDYGNRPLSASAVTDASGRFTVEGLLPGAAWRFYIGGQPRAAGGLWGYSQAEYPPYKVGDVMLPPMTLAAGERRDLGSVIVLRADATVAGRVVGPDGKPVAAPLAVEVDGDHTRETVFLGPDGTFHAQHIVHEPLTLSVYRSHNGFSGGPKGPDFVLQMPVSAGDQNVRVSVPAQPPAPFPPVFTPPPPPPVKPMFTFDYNSLPHLAVVARAKTHGPVPDEAAAVRAAETFLKQIGEPGAVAVQPEFSGTHGAFPATWSLLTSSGPGLRLTLTKDSGMVVEASDATAPGPFAPAPAPDPPGAPAPPTLTEGQAMRRGTAILRAAGIPREYTFVGTSRLPHQWVLYWMMRVRGVPFPYGGSPTERLDDRTGRLLGMRLWYLPPEPQAAPEKVNAAGAAGVADTLLAKAGLPPGADTPPFKQVVYPNGAWDTPPPPAPTPMSRLPAARVAWVVQRALPSRPPGAEVWVDAQTGAILGGLRPQAGEPGAGGE